MTHEERKRLLNKLTVACAMGVIAFAVALNAGWHNLAGFLSAFIFVTAVLGVVIGLQGVAKIRKETGDK